MLPERRFDGIRLRESLLVYGERDFGYGKRVDNASGWYIAGFVDGEGCFFIGKETCSFIIKLRADDRDLLEWIQSQFGGIGKIRDASGAIGNRNPQVALTVTRHVELVWLTEFFDVFRLVGKKRRDYAIWRDAVIEHANGMPVADLAAYKGRLAVARAFR